MTPAERVDTLVVELESDNAKLFCERTGLSTPVLSKLRSGKAVLHRRHVDLICKAYPEVNEDWLMSGKGEPYPKRKPMSKTAEMRILEKLDSLLERIEAMEKLLRDSK